MVFIIAFERANTVTALYFFMLVSGYKLRHNANQINIVSRGQCNICRNGSLGWWIFTHGCFLITHKHIIIIITSNTNKQINFQLIDPGNEQRWRKRVTLSTHQLGCHPQPTWDKLSDCTISPQAYCTVLHKHIYFHCTRDSAHLIVYYGEILGFCAVDLQDSVFGLCLIAPHQKVPLERKRKS